MTSNLDVVDNSDAVIAMHIAVAAMADALMVRAAAALLRRKVQQLKSVADLFSFLCWVCAVPISIGAGILCLNLFAGGFLTFTQAKSLYLPLFISDCLGILLIVPLFERLRHGNIAVAKLAKQVAIVSLLCLLFIALTFNDAPGFIYFILPILLFAASRNRETSALFGVVVSVVSVISLAANDLGPFKLVDTEQSIFMMMSFLFIVTITVQSIVLHMQDLVSTRTSRDVWQKRAFTDPLSELANRAQFELQLAEALQTAAQTKLPVSLAMIDIDHFKKLTIHMDMHRETWR